MGVLPDLSKDKKAYDHVFNDVPLGLRNRPDGGPHGLGIPEDKSLSAVEKSVLLPAVMREIILREFCAKEEKDYTSCTTQNRFTSYFKCSDDKCKLDACIMKFRHIKGLEEQAMEEYLYERSQYRLTGLTKSYRENKDLVPPGRQILFFEVPSFEEFNSISTDTSKPQKIWDSIMYKFRDMFRFKNP